MIKNEPLESVEQFVHLVNALCWDYTAEDHIMIIKLKVFETLTSGSGDKMHPLSRAWGREKNHFGIELKREEKFSLAARLRQAFEFLT